MHIETNRPMVFASLIIAMFITAIEGTIVATAMPSIVADLGGFSLFSWVFSAFLLTQVITIPIYGKLADLFGRKPVFIIGTLIFMVGTVACGFASSMQLLIIFRLIQGIGAGAIQPIATTIIGDIYSIQERAAIQAYISSVWGISSIVGPALGGIFVQYFHWAWVFWVNIPLGILTIAGVSLFLKESVERKSHHIDYVGSGILFIAISSLMLVLVQGGVSWAWSSPQILGLLAVFALGLPIFVYHEMNAQEPVMPMSIWRDQLIAVANLAALTTGIVMMGVSIFLPTFVQGVLGGSPMTAGFTLSMMSVGWPIAASVTGKLMLRYNPRLIATAGGIALVAGSLILINLHSTQSPVIAGIGAFFIGVGMGLTSTTFIIAIQSSVDWRNRGAATASNMFMRMLGNTIGAAVLGSLLNGFMSGYLKVHAASSRLPFKLDVTNILLDEEKRKTLTQGVITVLRDGLIYSVHKVYLGVLLVSLLSLVLIYFMPRGHREFSEG